MVNISRPFGFGLVALIIVVAGLVWPCTAWGAYGQWLPWDCPAQGLPLRPGSGAQGVSLTPDFQWGYENCVIQHDVTVSAHFFLGTRMLHDVEAWGPNCHNEWPDTYCVDGIIGRCDISGPYGSPPTNAPWSCFGQIYMASNGNWTTYIPIRPVILSPNTWYYWAGYAHYDGLEHINCPHCSFGFKTGAGPRPPAPVLAGSCLAPGTQATLTWSAVPGADFYSIRVDDLINPWSGNCSALNPGDYCADVTGTTYVFPTTPGHTYHAWIHSRINANPGYWSPQADATFSCPLPSCTASCVSAAINGQCQQSSPCKTTAQRFDPLPSVNFTVTSSNCPSGVSVDASTNQFVGSNTPQNTWLGAVNINQSGQVTRNWNFCNSDVCWTFDAGAPLYWRVVNNANSQVLAICPAFTAPCTNPVVEAAVSPTPTGPWHTGSLDVYMVTEVLPPVYMYIRGVANPASALSGLFYDTPAGAFSGSISNPISSRAYGIDITTWPLGTNAAPRTYRVRADAGGTGGYCPASGPASFECRAAPPSISFGSPTSGQTLNSLPTSFGIYVIGCGMDRCGSNDNSLVTGNDTMTYSLHSGSSCSGPLANNVPAQTAPIQCLKNQQLSLPNVWTNITEGTYTLCVTIHNGALPSNTLSVTFTYFPAAGAWWQAGSGHVYALGSIGSSIPSFCSGVDCYFNLAGAGDYSGVSVYGDSFNVTPPDRVAPTPPGGRGWTANTISAVRIPSYDDFFRQVPVLVETFDNPTLDSSVIPSVNTGGSDAVYLEYMGTATLDISDLSLGLGKKVVVFVPNTSDGLPITTTFVGDISIDHANGFFGLVTRGPVTIDPGVRQIDGLILTGSTFATVPKGSGEADDPLVVTGTVVAKGGVTLGRDLDTTPRTNMVNNTTPAEKFVYSPSLLFNLPRALRRVQYELTEVAPSGE